MHQFNTHRGNLNFRLRQVKLIMLARLCSIKITFIVSMCRKTEMQIAFSQILNQIFIGSNTDMNPGNPFFFV